MRLLAVAACSAALLMLAGCGSNGGSEPTGNPTASVASATTSTPAPSTQASSDSDARLARKSFVKKASRICRDYNRSIFSVKRELKKIGTSGNVDVYAPAIKRAVSASDLALERFQALVPPPGDRAQVDLIFRAIRGLATGNQLLLKAARDDDPVAYGATQAAITQATPAYESAMSAYGMTVCGSEK